MVNRPSLCDFGIRCSWARLYALRWKWLDRTALGMAPVIVRNGHSSRVLDVTWMAHLPNASSGMGTCRQAADHTRAHSFEVTPPVRTYIPTRAWWRGQFWIAKPMPDIPRLEMGSASARSGCEVSVRRRHQGWLGGRDRAGTGLAHTVNDVLAELFFVMFDHADQGHRGNLTKAAQ